MENERNRRASARAELDWWSGSAAETGPRAAGQRGSAISVAGGISTAQFSLRRQPQDQNTNMTAASVARCQRSQRGGTSGYRAERDAAGASWRRDEVRDQQRTARIRVAPRKRSMPRVRSREWDRRLATATGCANQFGGKMRGGRSRQAVFSAVQGNITRPVPSPFGFLRPRRPCCAVRTASNQTPATRPAGHTAGAIVNNRLEPSHSVAGVVHCANCNNPTTLRQDQDECR